MLLEKVRHRARVDRVLLPFLVQHALSRYLDADAQADKLRVDIAAVRGVVDALADQIDPIVRFIATTSISASHRSRPHSRAFIAEERED
ncbi:hypothetical protein [Bosea sp. PAMC 26642]|uniref:hypothetical protein n=1 Tax=Bosea sp. (strain PAMC 26642) TaxID=1792307 RepID=UPI00076FE5BA|nr:hypothetical protein [Bosea sp. PAMC 26642]AMJ59649.1 hypothetical protein AXW83_04425 [Bosea sp. PAMC 26642]